MNFRNRIIQCSKTKIVFFYVFILFIGMPHTFRAQERGSKTIQYSQEDTASINLILKEAFDITKQQNSALSLPQYKKALQASRAINYEYGIAYSLTGIAQVELNNGNTIEAFSLLQEAEQTNKGKSTNAIKLHAFIANTKGICFDNIGYYDSALSYFLNAINLRESVKQKPPLTYYNNAGLLLQKMGNYNKAEYYYNKALSSKDINHKDSVTLAAILLNKAGMYFQHTDEKSIDTAIQLTQKALTLSRSFPPSNLQARAIINIAAFMLNYKHVNTAKVLSYLKEAEKIPGISKENQISLYNNLAYIYFDLKQYATGDDYLEKALKLANSFSSKEYLISVYQALEYGQRDRRNFEKAYQYGDIIKLLKDSLGMKKNALKVNYLLYQYESSQRDNELIKKELLISQHEVALQRRKTVIISLLGSTGTLCALFYFYFRYRRKIERQKMKFVTWSAAMEAEEKERARLARELHDNIGGSLSTVKMWFGTLQKKADDEHRERKFEEAMQLLDQTLNDLRDTAHHLMPEVLTRYGLAKAVQIYCENIQKAGELDVEYNYYGFMGETDKKLDLVIYRIIQELLQNVIKHAKASFLLVQLSRHDDTLGVTIEDNGLGMEKIDEANGMGLQNIKTSITNLDGHFNVLSEKGHGTTIYFEINVAKS